MNDPDVPRMKPDLPQFSGITPDRRAGRRPSGAEGPASTRKRIVLAWGLWDWGSAAFNAVVTTFVFTVYLTSSSFGPEGTVEAQLGWALAAAGLLIAVLAPVTGQRSDTSGRRKFWLAVNTYIVVALTAAMFFVQPDPVVPLARDCSSSQPATCSSSSPASTTTRCCRRSRLPARSGA